MSVSFALDWVRQRPNQPLPLAEPIQLDMLPTPALVLNRPALERNIQVMASHLQSHGKGFRPHAKTHKCPIICGLQMQAGAVGVCVAKVGEAAAMAHAGVDDVLITSPVTTAVKAGVVAELSRVIDQLRIVVDSPAGLAVLQEALAPDDRLTVLIDLDVAMGRTGTRDRDQALALWESVGADARLRFAGVQHYAGHLMHVEDYSKRRDKSLTLWEKISEHLEAFAARGMQCEIVTGSGTGTYNIDVDVPCITDLQVGSYIFMDEEYRQVHPAADRQRFDDFEVSLHVACTTISQPRDGAITVDGGFKAFASDSVAPVTDDYPGVVFHFAGDEHGVLALGKGEQEIRLGQNMRFVVPHCDPTVNLHDFYWVQEADGLIHSLWPVTARGAAPGRVRKPLRISQGSNRMRASYRLMMGRSMVWEITRVSRC